MSNIMHTYSRPQKFVMKSNLRAVSGLLKKQHTKWFAAVEQSGLSASNFLYSAIVLYAADVASLGEYGFWFVIGQLMAMSVLGLTIRQMVLQSANLSYKRQITVFSATLKIVLCLQCLQIVFIFTLVALRESSELSSLFALSLSIYILTLNLSELLRQFLYMRGKQRLSVFYTAVSLLTSVTVFAIIALVIKPDKLEGAAFSCLALGHGMYALIAASTFCRQKNIWGNSNGQTLEVFRNNWRYGRWGTAGMAVTWLQNQSVTPLLMLMFGPLVTGYYQIARMVVTPVNMITTGLQKSALPQLRRTFGDGNDSALAAEIHEHMLTSMKIVFGFVVAIVIVSVGIISLGYKGNWATLAPMFVSAIIVMVLSNYRFWFTQRFVVRMEFDVLLKIGILASALTIGAMFFAGYALENAYLVILSSALGELYLVQRLKQRLT